MDAKIHTDDQIEALRTMPKRVTDPNVHWVYKSSAGKTAHHQRTFNVVGQPVDTESFTVYQRQNVDDPGDFSCGILYNLHESDRIEDDNLMLARYNGVGHKHGDISHEPHIHKATEAAMIAGREPDSFAEVTDRFETIEGAFDCLKADFNIEGFPVEQDALGPSDDH